MKFYVALTSIIGSFLVGILANNRGLEEINTKKFFIQSIDVNKIKKRCFGVFSVKPDGFFR